MRARSRAALFVTALAAVAWSLVPAAPAGAAAGITISDLSVDMFPNAANQVRIHGTATCSTTTGTATLTAHVSQDLQVYRAWGFGITTVSCADQPAHWSVSVPPLSLCTYPGGLGCFQPDSVAYVWASLARNGVQEASISGEFPT